MKKILIFIGPPGSGKGTQAKLLAKKYGYKHISTGDLFRALASDKNVTEKEKQALEEMKSGKLVSDWLVYDLAFKEIKKNLETGVGVVLDGAIRSVEQAEEFQKFFEKYGWENEVQSVEVAISDEESFNRLTKRRICSKCDEIIPYLPTTKDLTSCPKCGGELVSRKDDNEQVIKARIEKQGNKILRPILDYYSKKRMLKVVDGMKGIAEVETEIKKSINF
ncbi:MAG: nucleoside monophosphate kinase [Candidatus Magasanikbacteria bacterium]